MPENHPSVLRVKAALRAAGHHDNVTALDDAARTAKEAAAALGIEVGQVASSIVFGLESEGEATPLLVITSGQHKVDTQRVAEFLGVEKLLRADADFVRRWSGFAIGGVSPLGWEAEPATETTITGHPADLVILVDTALDTFDEVWAAAGHPHTVFPTTFAELVRMTQGTPCDVGVRSPSE
ncbi:MAG: hypothetical protein RIS43_28 [Actinomycetota bacterium]